MSNPRVLIGKEGQCHSPLPVWPLNLIHFQESWFKYQIGVHCAQCFVICGPKFREVLGSGCLNVEDLEHSKREGMKRQALGLAVSVSLPS